MLTKEGFDRWARDYDADVQRSESNNEYPFAGYGDVLRGICAEAVSAPGKDVLDLGFGTAVLSSFLYCNGYKISGIDFSQGMIDAARKKMPEALLLCGDFTRGLPEELNGRTFDTVIATYSIHHLAPENRPDFLLACADRLKNGGKILIGDVMFRTEAEQEACRSKFRDIWDDDELYILVDRLAPQIEARGLSCRFDRKSFCSGILVIQRQ